MDEGRRIEAAVEVMRLRHPGAVWVFLCLLVGSVAAEEAPNAWVVPNGLADVRGSDVDEALAAGAVRTIERVGALDAERDALLDARGLLVLLEDVGLRHVAERLAQGALPQHLLPHLLHVVASAGHAAADDLLARAAAEPHAGLRIIAADGLGRDRTVQAVEALARLARDPVPGVRAAALRSLFAMTTDAAVEARQALPRDERPDLHERRLRWHRLRGRANAGLRPLALETWQSGRTPKERIEAALLLARPELATPLEILHRIVEENGTDALGAAAVRLALGVERTGYDAFDMRKAAILAAFVAAWRPDAPDRALMIDRMVGWLAEPAWAATYEKRPRPENILRMALPDLGEALIEPTVRRLRLGRFWDPQRGVTLLIDALPEERAAAALVPLLDPSAEPAVATSVRVAVSGGMRSLRRIGDEALARRLLRSEEEAPIRRDVARALEGDDASWAIPLLGEQIAADDTTITDEVIATLEARPEPEARQLLIGYLFRGPPRRPPRPEVRLEHLVRPADDTAFEIVERALNDPWDPLRRAALRQLSQMSSLRGPRALALLRTFEPLSKNPQARTNEFQQMLYAWFALAPQEGLAWMRANWQDFTAIDWEHVAIRSLKNLGGKEAAPWVIDLVLEKAAVGAPAAILQEAPSALEGRRGHRDEEVDALLRRALSHENSTVVAYAIDAIDHPGHANLTDLLLPLLAGLDTAEPADLPEIEALLEALRYQPIEGVESVLLDIVLNANALPGLRTRAATGLLGRISAEGRDRLVAWLTTPGADEEALDVARAAARVLGTDGGREIAEHCLEVLRRLLFEAYDSPAALDPEVPSENDSGLQIGTLAHAIAFTTNDASVEAVLELIFDERFARYARRAVEQHGRRLGPVDASAGGQPGPGLHTLWHRADGLYAPLPWEIAQILDNLKPVSDERLTPMYERRLAKLRQTGRLAAFPDLYLDRVIAYLRDRATGDRVQAAEVVARWVGPTEPVGGAADFNVARDRVERFAREGRFEEAAAAQSSVLAILSHRAYDDEPGWRWRIERAAVDAWAGAALMTASDVEGAEAHLQRSVLWNAYSTQVLGTASLARGRAGADLDLSLVLAQRAATLELRVLDELSFGTADTLAFALLRAGQPKQAAKAIRPILRRAEQRSAGGRYHLRSAQALTTAGEIDGASAAILKALELEPSLDEEMRRDPWLAPLRETGRLETLVRMAKEEALSSIFN